MRMRVPSPKTKPAGQRNTVDVHLLELWFKMMNDDIIFSSKLGKIRPTQGCPF